MGETTIDRVRGPWWVAEEYRESDRVPIWGPDGDRIATAESNIGLGWTAWDVAQTIISGVMLLDADAETNPSVALAHQEAGEEPT